MISSKITSHQAKKILDELIKNNKSLTLATTNMRYLSHSSYAPFIYCNNKFYILVSSISKHTKNMIQNPTIGGMIIEDEQKAKLIWFRQRIHYHFLAKKIKKPPELLLQILKKRFGLVFNQLWKMNFIIFELSIIKGLMLLGPGIIFDVDNDNLVTKTKHPGHK